MMEYLCIRMTANEQYMARCIELAGKGLGSVAPNPLVGAVLVYQNRVIGEGWHKQFGKAHAEVNCIASVELKHRHLVKDSILYVSLEPCAHHGKTPPCTDLIIQQGIRQVVIGCVDPYHKVAGKGIDQLKAAGIKITTGILETACRELNRRFFTSLQKQRPYIILKWAETADHFIAYDQQPVDGRLMITGETSNRLVHKWRSEEAAIMAGANTILLDDPILNTRLWQGPSPVRLIIDKELSIPRSAKIFDNSSRTIVFNLKKQSTDGDVHFHKLDEQHSFLEQVLSVADQSGLQSIFVEGGAKLLSAFIAHGLWDEARVITNQTMKIKQGLPSPVLSNHTEIEKVNLENDLVTIYRRLPDA